jgi:hypothetical protein
MTLFESLSVIKTTVDTLRLIRRQLQNESQFDFYT